MMETSWNLLQHMYILFQWIFKVLSVERTEKSQFVVISESL